MMYKHGEEYGDGVLWAEEGHGSRSFLLGGRVPLALLEKQIPPIIVYVTVQGLIFFFYQHCYFTVCFKQRAQK